VFFNPWGWAWVYAITPNPSIGAIMKDFHEVANVFPLMEGDEFDQLCTDIKQNGLIEPIWLHPDGRIIDGRNRYRACLLTETPPQYRTWSGEGSLVSFVVSLNLHRRHLTASQRAVVGLDIKDALMKEIEIKKKSIGKQNAEKRWDKERIGAELYDALRPHLEKRMSAREKRIEQRRSKQQTYFILDGNRIKIGVSLDPDVRLKELKTGNPSIELIGSCPGGIELEKALHKEFVANRISGEWFHYTEELKDKIDGLIGLFKNEETYNNEEARDAWKEAGKIVGVSVGYLSHAKHLQQEAPDLLEQVRTGAVTLPQAKKEVARRNTIEKLENIAAQAPQEVTGVFDVVVIDPPWPIKKIERDITPNQVEFEYPTMALDEITAIEIPAADDCHLFVWTTQKYLPPALDIVKQWGFKYVLTFVWHKNGGFQPFGLPMYNCEFVIYARKGAPQFFDFTDFKTCFEAPRRAHSEKPEEFYSLIRRVTRGRRLDMFNRRAIDGFIGWGNEA